MAANMLSAVIFVVAVLTPFAIAVVVPISVIDKCKDTGIEHFDVSTVCDNIFYIHLMSANAADVDCACLSVSCIGGDVKFNTFLVRNSVLDKVFQSNLSRIVGAGQGVWYRHFTKPNIPGRITYLKSQTHYMADNQGIVNTKFSYALCDPATGLITNEGIASNYKGVYYDEARQLLVNYEDRPLANIPNNCHCEDYVNN